MKKSRKASWLLCIGTLICFAGCKKATTEPPQHTVATVETSRTVVASSTTLTIGESSVISDGGAPVTARGVCWSSTVIPTIANNKTTDGSGTGTFTSTLTGLTPNTTYTYRAYATNSVGTGYGNPVVVTTTSVQTVPAITATDPSVITSKAAVISADVTSDGNTPVTARGFCWSTSPNPTIANTKTVEGQGVGYFTTTIENLTVNTVYYVRGYATNSVGTAYSNEIAFRAAYLIGELVGGGRLFYLDNTKLHGLIAAVADPVSGATWQVTNTTVFLSANAYSYSNGLDNTTRIVNAMGTFGTAAAVCWNYAHDGYTDWYLPSINELTVLMTFQNNTNFNFPATRYWSSTENSSYIGWAWNADFSAAYDAAFKTSLAGVRPIRAF